MKSNARFVALWAALVPVLTSGTAIVGYDRWSVAQTALVTAEINAFSAVVLAAVAYLWARSVSEPAALQGALSAFALATLTMLAGFDIVELDDTLTNMIVGLVGLVFVLVLTAWNRSVAYAPETVERDVVAAAKAARGQVP